jgi:glycosyltransferase involved in cell wall biosynthesis
MIQPPHTNARIAVLVPCYNEATTVAKVVQDFRKELPNATIYVFDNNSTDGTADVARAAGAVVHAGESGCRLLRDDRR